MYSGQYHKPVRKRKTRKKPGILIVSLVLLLAVVVGGSVAFLQDTTNQVENTFTPAKVEIDPTEATTPTTKSDIKFQNTGDVPVYIRATLVIYWKDSEGNFVAPPSGGSVKVGDVDVHDAQPLNGWSKVGDIYYYDSPVPAGEWTGEMLDTITVTTPTGYTCYIDVRAEAIQADGMDATSAQDAWAKAKESSSSGS